MLSAIDLTISYGKNTLFKEVSHEFDTGKIYGLVAPNGYGKTTFLRTLAGLEGPSVSGEIVVDKMQQPIRAAWRSLVFFAPGEGTLLYADMTARDHLEMTRKLWQSPRSIAETSSLFHIESYLNKRVRTLSQGMRQQLTLAISYMTNARYLLLDEPMNALDPTNVMLDSSILRDFACAGRCVLMSSHILENMDQLCDELLFVKDGDLLAVNDARAIDAYRELYGTAWT